MAFLTLNDDGELVTGDINTTGLTGAVTGAGGRVSTLDGVGLSTANGSLSVDPDALSAQGFVTDSDLSERLNEAGYLSKQAINQKITDAVDAQTHLSRTEVEQAIDDRGYLTEAEIAQQIDASVSDAAASLNPKKESGSKPVDAIDVTMEGLDDTGEEDIGGKMDELVSRVPDGSTLWFPDGEYHVRSLTELGGTNGLTLSFADNASFVFDGGEEGFDGGRWRRGIWRSHPSNPARNLTIEGLTIDFGGEAVGNGIFCGDIGGKCTFRDIDVRGQYSYRKRSRCLFTVRAIDPETIISFERVWLPDGSIHQSWDYDSQPVPFMLVEGGHDDATIRFQDCVACGWPNNGIYGSRPNARVVIEGGIFLDNDHSNIRIGGKRSVIRDATIGVTPNVDKTFQTCRNIWVRHGADFTIDSCDLFRADTDVQTSVITVDSNAGATTIQNCRIRTLDRGWNFGVFVGEDEGTDQQDRYRHNSEVVIDSCLFAWDSGGKELPAIATYRPNTKIRDCRFIGNIGGNEGDASAVEVRSGKHGDAHETVVRDCTVREVGLLADVAADDVRVEGGYEVNDCSFSGTRGVRNGTSTNAGNPKTGGEWYGNGYEGVVVYDRVNGYTRYEFVDGSWRTG